jgi:putative ABC transport system substrate-binding protein
MRRRNFIIATVGVVTAWPVAARAEQSAMPVIGYLAGSSPAYRAHLLTAFLRGIRDTGYVEGENVIVEYRWAQDQYDRLPDLIADLTRRHAVVIAATDTPSAIAAKAATTTLPIVFASGADPVKEGPSHYA